MKITKTGSKIGGEIYKLCLSRGFSVRKARVWAKIFREEFSS